MVIVECVEPAIVDKMWLHTEGMTVFQRTNRLDFLQRNKIRQNRLRSTSLSNVIKQDHFVREVIK